MRHIKLFESFKTEDYYQEITVHEYDDLLGLFDSWRDDEDETSTPLRGRISDVDFNKLKKLFSDRRYLPYRVDDDGFEDESGDGVYVDGSYVDKESVSIWVDSLEDDWYVVSTPCGYYKCDQWDGLIRLLSDKGYLNSPKPEPEKRPENYEEILNRKNLRPGRYPIQEAFSEDDYYKEISTHDYAQAEIIEFPASLEYKIRFRLEDGYEIERRGSHMGVTIYNDEPTTDGLWHGDWSIYLMEDEWFLVETEFSEGDITFFKCDQWDGLMRLLKRYKVAY